MRLRIGDSVIISRNTHPAFRNAKRFYKKNFIGKRATVIRIDEKVQGFQVLLKFEDEETEKMNIADGGYLFEGRDLDKT